LTSVVLYCFGEEYHGITFAASCLCWRIEAASEILFTVFDPEYHMLLQGALRNAIATFVRVSPVLKDTIWSYLEQYDLPVVVGKSAQPMSAQVSMFEWCPFFEFYIAN